MDRPQDLPPPYRMRNLPRDDRGFVVPWFVAWVDEAGELAAIGQGRPEFRAIRPNGTMVAHRAGICFLCGKHLSAKKTFAIGCMCLVNRVSSEPPSHYDCAEYATTVCPFLTKPKMVRNTKDLPANVEDPGGVMIERNPGVTVLWTTRHYSVISAGKPLFKLGDPERLEFRCQGRPATLEEVAESVRTGLPILAHYARQDGPDAFRAFEAAVLGAVDLVPGLDKVLEETAA
jgi:hypothetical protein